MLMLSSSFCNYLSILRIVRSSPLLSASSSINTNANRSTRIIIARSHTTTTNNQTIGAMSAQPFIIDAHHLSSSPSARSGLLSTRSGSLATPNAFFYAPKSNFAHLVPSLARSIPELRGLHLSMAELAHGPGAEVVAKLGGKGGWRVYANLDQPRIGSSPSSAAAAASSPSAASPSVDRQYILYMTARDPLLDSSLSGNDHGVSVLASQGSLRLSSSLYAELCARYNPDIICSLCDEVGGSALANRCRKASQRTVRWLDDLHEGLEAAEKKQREQKGEAMEDTIPASAASAASSSVPSGPSTSTPSAPVSTIDRPLIFASLAGGADLEQRRANINQYMLRIADSASASASSASSASDDSARSGSAGKHIDGFVLTGLGSGEDRAKRDEILVSSLALLPSSKPRVLSSSSASGGAPSEFIKAVDLGFDLVEVTYPHQLTILGQASTFRYDFSSASSSSSSSSSSEAREMEDAVEGRTKINLRDARYARDARPIALGCACFTCVNHSRAYMHHLLNVHEMTAPILLDLHNLHHYTAFVAHVRSILSSPRSEAGAGGFAMYKKRFMDSYMPSSSASGASGAAGVDLCAPAVHAHQVGRATLTPSTPVLAIHVVRGSGQKFVMRRIAQKDSLQVAQLIREVMTELGASGPGFAIHDKEVDDMYRAYETSPAQVGAAGGLGLANEGMDDVPSSSSSSSSSYNPSAVVNRSAYFVVTAASDDARVLGCGGIAPLLGSEGGGVGEVRKFYFRPCIRSVGLGTELMRIIEQHARSLEYKGMYVETTATMAQAIKMYTRNGFGKIEKQMGNTGHHACDELYYKQL